MPLSKELSKAIGLKCTDFQTTLVGYMIGVEWLSTKAVQGIMIHQVPGRLVLKGCLVLKGRLVSKSRADFVHTCHLGAINEDANTKTSAKKNDHA